MCGGGGSERQYLLSITLLLLPRPAWTWNNFSQVHCMSWSSLDVVPWGKMAHFDSYLLWKISKWRIDDQMITLGLVVVHFNLQLPSLRELRKRIRDKNIHNLLSTLTLGISISIHSLSFLLFAFTKLKFNNFKKSFFKYV